jgi:beta-1,4-N-acetylglucosaminyltransferase
MPERDKPKKIAVICSSGGHLVQSLMCLDAFAQNNVFLVTYNSPTLVKFSDPRASAVYFVRYFGDSYLRVIASLFVSIFTFIRILLKERPDILFSTGSEIAIPPFFLGKLLFGTRLIYLESLTRVTTVSGTGKLLYPIVDLFLVQSKELLKHLGKKAVYEGSLL